MFTENLDQASVFVSFKVDLNAFDFKHIKKMFNNINMELIELSVEVE